MKHLFAVRDDHGNLMEGPIGVQFFDKKTVAKQVRNEYNANRSGNFYVTKGPDHDLHESHLRKRNRTVGGSY